MNGELSAGDTLPRHALCRLFPTAPKCVSQMMPRNSGRLMKLARAGELLRSFFVAMPTFKSRRVCLLAIGGLSCCGFHAVLRGKNW